MTDEQPPTMPADIDAERAYIGAALASPSAAREALALVGFEDFYSARHGKILTALREEIGLDPPPDESMAMRVYDRLAGEGNWTATDDKAFADCIATGASAAMLKRHAATIRTAAAERSLILAATQIQHEARDKGQPEAIAARAIEAMREAQRLAVPRIRPDTSLRAGIAECFARLERVTDGKCKELGVQTGLIDLDAMTGGMRPGELVVLGARPSVGKSAFALTAALHAARNAGHVWIESLEMSRMQVCNRLMAQVARVKAEEIRDGLLEAENWPPVIAAANEMLEARISGSFAADRRLSEILADIHHEHETQKLALVVIDYIGLIRPDEPGESRRHEVEAVSRALKAEAKRLGVPFLVLAQVNRESSKQDREPRISDLRETGQIEADADQVWLLHRAVVSKEGDEGEPRLDPTNATLFVGKNRDGCSGAVKLHYRAHLTQFTNAER